MILYRQFREGDTILIPACMGLDYENRKWIVVDRYDLAEHAPCRTRSQARAEKRDCDLVTHVLAYMGGMIRVRIVH